MAKFQPGHKLAKGRPKGSPNVDKRTVREIVEACLGRSLIEEIVDRIEEMKKLNKPIALKALMDLAQYCYPKLASTQVSAEINAVTGEDKVRALAEQLNAAKTLE